MNTIVTGCAGFIGSHLVDALLARGDRVIGYDNMSTGVISNLSGALDGARNGKPFRFYKVDLAKEFSIPEDTEVVYHLAALGSVPRSLANPIDTNESNVTPFVRMVDACKSLNLVPRIVFASSSSVYGDSPKIVRHEEEIGNPLSPYAASKQINELYAKCFSLTYGLQFFGMRFFNVFGPRQLPDSPYSAVIPKWAAAMLADRPVEIYGNPERSRDFTPVKQVVDALIRAAHIPIKQPFFEPINVGTGISTSLIEVFQELKHLTGSGFGPIIRPDRPGDVYASEASLNKMGSWIGFPPATETFRQSLAETVAWIRQHRDAQATRHGLH